MFTFSSIRTCVLLAATGCGHDAWLGMSCPSSDMRCDDAGLAAGTGALDAGHGLVEPVSLDATTATSPTAAAESGASSSPPDAQAASAPADAAPLDAAAMLPETCRSVTMNYFACATGTEISGAPRLLGGQPYTLRFHGDYAVDTTFQLQGATAACSLMMFGNLTLVAGEAAAERCLTPNEEIALLVTVVSGDVQVWMQNGLRAEICDGCGP